MKHKLLLLFSLLWLSVIANAQNDTIYLEAEKGFLNTGWLDTTLAQASAGKGIVGATSSTSEPQATAQYYFNIPAAGLYRFAARIKSTNNNNDSFFYRVNGNGSWKTKNNNGAKDLEWVSFANDSLPAGWNVLEIGSREQAILDKFVLSTDSAFIANLTNEEGDSAVNINGPLEPTDSNGIWLEAEYGIKNGSWNIVASSEASNDSMLTPGSPTTSNSPNSTIQYYFNVDSTDIYKIWLRVEEARNGGFFFRINGEGNWVRYNDFGTTNDLYWYSNSNQLVDTLPQGLNFIEIGSREVLNIDKILITNTPGFVPFGKGQEARNLTEILGPPKSKDTTLADLSIGGSTITGFADSIYMYEVSLQQGADSIIAARANDQNATVKISQPSSIPGTGSVTVVAENGIDSATYTITFKLIVSVTDLTAATVTAYPNPTSNILIVEGAVNQEVKLINSMGKIVYTTIGFEESIKIDVSSLAGMYVLFVNNTPIQKILVE